MKNSRPPQRAARPSPGGRQESGAVTIIVAVCMVAFLGLAALVVDLGGLYKHDRDLQTMADAGALAGAIELVYTYADNQNTTEAMAAGHLAAEEYVAKNTRAQARGSTVTAANLQSWNPAVTANSVTVDLQENRVPFVFAPVIGNREGSVTAHAKAEVKYFTGYSDVGSMFPAAILYMNPDHFHFVYRSGKTEVARFNLRDNNDDGVYDQGGTSYTPTSPGLYTVSLQAVDQNDQIGLELPNIGYWRVPAPTDKLLRVGMAQAIGSHVVTVRALVAPSVTAATLSATLGSGFTLTYAGNEGTNRAYQGTVTAPAAGTPADGYTVVPLTISAVASGAVGTYVSFADDVPLNHLLMLQPPYDGYSGIVGQSASLGGVIGTRHLEKYQPYVMALGKSGNGLYSGNWRLADIYNEANLREQIATLDPQAEGWTWKAGVPPRIGGPLITDPGAKTGPVYQGLNDRTDNNNAPADDPRRVVIVPIVNFAPDLNGRDDWTIYGFAAFRITDFGKHDDVVGEFIDWVKPGSWSGTKPPGELDVKTVVLTQ